MRASKSLPGDAQGESWRFAVADARLAAVAYWCLTGLVVAGALAFGHHAVRPVSAPERDSRDWLEVFTRMDGRWYKQIASEGYRYNSLERSNVAFFPVYPLIVRFVAAITGARAEIVLVAVSNVSFLAALVILAIYARERRAGSSASLPEYTLLACALYPPSLFFRLAYSESTFLLISLVAMYAIVRRWPLWLIAITVAIGTAARPVGIALVAPFAIHLVRTSESVNWSHTAIAPRRASCLMRALIYIPLSCVGLAAFIGYQYAVFHEPFAAFKIQQHWRVGAEISWGEKVVALVTMEPLWVVYSARSEVFWAIRDTHGIALLSLQFANPIFFVGAAALIFLGARWHWLSAEEVAFATFLLLIPYLTRAAENGMGSMGRFTAPAFPIYMVAARLLEKLPAPHAALILATSSCLMAANAALYATGYAVF